MGRGGGGESMGMGRPGVNGEGGRGSEVGRRLVGGAHLSEDQTQELF